VDKKGTRFPHCRFEPRRLRSLLFHRKGRGPITAILLQRHCAGVATRLCPRVFGHWTRKNDSNIQRMNNSCDCAGYLSDFVAEKGLDSNFADCALQNRIDLNVTNHTASDLADKRFPLITHHTDTMPIE